MPPGLITLLRLQARSRFRRVLRGARTPRGMVFLIMGTMMICLYLLPQIVEGLKQRTGSRLAMNRWTPIGLLAFCLLSLLTSAGERAFYFAPAEVDFVFPGPFTRRQILLYKIARSIGAMSVGALILSCFAYRGASHWMAAYIGVLLTLLFIQLFGMCVSLIRQTMEEAIFNRMQRYLLLAAVAALALIAWRLSPDDAQASAERWAARFSQSSVGHIVLAPFAVFANTITAPTWAEFGRWASGSIAIDILLIAFVVGLDANYLESAALNSQRLYNKFRRRRARGLSTANPDRAAKRRLPPLPRFWGAGPIAWRQLTSTFRVAGGMFLIMAILCAASGPIVRKFLSREAIGPIVGIAAWLTVFLPNLFRFDFRGDLDQMDQLKSLPVRAAVISAGQLVAPVFTLTALHLLMLLSLAYVEPQYDRLYIAVVPLLVPFNTLLFEVENIVFLFFPEREGFTGPGDLQGSGRRLVILMFKLLVLGLAAGIAFTLSAIVFRLTDGAMYPTVGTAAAVLLVAALGLLPLVAWAFLKFDPSVHTPAS